MGPLQHRAELPRRVALGIISVAACLQVALSQLSDPIAHEDNIHHLTQDNKFLKRTATADSHAQAQEEPVQNEDCPVGLELLWQTEVSSSIYSTPLISDINRDGKAEIVIPSFVHYLEVLEGDDGERAHGWPAFYRSSAHTSPILHDVDLDGMREVLLADYNGEVLVFNYAGQELPRFKMTVPRLRVRKDWYVGLAPDHVDHEHPDIHAKIQDHVPGGNGSHHASDAADNVLNLPKPQSPEERAQQGGQGSGHGQHHAREAGAEKHTGDPQLRHHPGEALHHEATAGHAQGHGGGHGGGHEGGQQHTGQHEDEVSEAKEAARRQREFEAQRREHMERMRRASDEKHRVIREQQEEYHRQQQQQQLGHEQHDAPKVPGNDDGPKVPGLEDSPKVPGTDEGPKVPGLQEGPQIPGQGAQAHSAHAQDKAQAEGSPGGAQKSPCEEGGLCDAKGHGHGMPHNSGAQNHDPAPADAGVASAHPGAESGEQGGSGFGTAQAAHTGEHGAGGAHAGEHGGAEASPHLDHPPAAVLKDATEEQVRLKAGWEAWHTKIVAAKGSLSEKEAKDWEGFLEWSKGLHFPGDPPQGQTGGGAAGAGAHPGGGVSSQRRRLLHIPAEEEEEVEEGGRAAAANGAHWHAGRRRLLQANEEHHEEHHEGEVTAEEGEHLDEEAAQSWDVFKDEDGDLPVEEGEDEDAGWNPEWGDEGDWNPEGEEGQGEEGVAGSQGALEEEDELHHDEEDEPEPQLDIEPTLHEEHEEPDHGVHTDMQGHVKGGHHDPGLHDEYPYEYDDYVDEKMWDDEDWSEAKHEAEKDFVGIDPHILCTPVIGDIDNDGADELVVASSYYFDKEYYEDPAHAKELEAGIDLGKYIAGGVVVFSLQTQQVRWTLHLDLTTDSTQFRAYIYSAPTLVDLDGDGQMEIIVGTSVGFIYVLTASGTLREGFPVQMGELQGQVVVGDINHDNQLELIGVDTRGNVAVFDINGKEVWERHTASLIAQGATLGDVNGDGICEVVVGTTAGYVYAFNGITGADAPGFPFRTHGRIMSPVLLVNLDPSPKLGGPRSALQASEGSQGGLPGMHLVVMSFDGFLYAISGKSSCADVYDIGETSYSMVLADNVDGGDDLDLVVTTMNGGVYCFSTPAAFHPLKAWPSQNHGRNVFFPLQAHEGVQVLPGSRVPRDIGRESFKLSFEIVDARAPPHEGTRKYNVQAWLLFQGQKTLVHNKRYEKPGKHTIVVESPLVRTYATFLIEMEDDRRFLFHDEFSLSFHMHYYRLLKWILVLPLVAMALALISRSPAESGPELPSYASRGHIA